MNREEICRKCGKCCMRHWLYTRDFDRALRFKLLHSNGMIEVKDIIPDDLWKIIFKYKCNELIYDEETKLFNCRIHEETRPKFCKDYPWNFLDKSVPLEVYKEEKEFCVLLKT